MRVTVCYLRVTGGTDEGSVPSLRPRLPPDAHAAIEEVIKVTNPVASKVVECFPNLFLRTGSETLTDLEEGCQCRIPSDEPRYS